MPSIGEAEKESECGPLHSPYSCPSALRVTKEWMAVARPRSTGCTIRYARTLRGSPNLPHHPKELLGRPFWAKPVLRSFSGPRIGSVGASCFVDDFVSCWGKRGAYRLLLEPSWRMFKVAFYDFVVWWLDCLLLKEGASALCSLRWLLEVFLAVAEFVGFRAGGRLPFESLYWILYCPLLAPLAPLDS